MADDDPRWAAAHGEALGGVVWVIAEAATPEDFQLRVTELLAEMGAVATEFEDVLPLAEHRRLNPDGNPFTDEVAELERTGRSQTSSWFTWARHGFATDADYVEHLARREDLTEPQRLVIEQLAVMLRQFDLALLDTVSNEDTDEGTAVTFWHAKEEGIDITVEVEEEAGISVAYEVGHTHFPIASKEELGSAFNFIAAALKGFVRVDLWEEGDQLLQSRSLLESDGDWVPVSETVWAGEPIRTPPDRSVRLGMARLQELPQA